MPTRAVFLTMLKSCSVQHFKNVKLSRETLIYRSVTYFLAESVTFANPNLISIECDKSRTILMTIANQDKQRKDQRKLSRVCPVLTRRKKLS